AGRTTGAAGRAAGAALGPTGATAGAAGRGATRAARGPATGSTSTRGLASGARFPAGARVRRKRRIVVAARDERAHEPERAQRRDYPQCLLGTPHVNLLSNGPLPAPPPCDAPHEPPAARARDMPRLALWQGEKLGTPRGDPTARGGRTARLGTRRGRPVAARNSFSQRNTGPARRSHRVKFGSLHRLAAWDALASDAAADARVDDSSFGPRTDARTVCVVRGAAGAFVRARQRTPRLARGGSPQASRGGGDRLQGRGPRRARRLQ